MFDFIDSKTPSHGGNRGSNPLGSAKQEKPATAGFFCLRNTGHELWGQFTYLFVEVGKLYQKLRLAGPQ